MVVWSRVLLFVVPLLLLALTAVAGYAYSQIRYLSLPIPQALALLTVVLPLVTGISTQGVYGLIKRSSQNEQYLLTIPLLAVIGFQLIYETIIFTLALTHMVPPSALKCGLNDQWQDLFARRDTKAIRTIQDAFECCGLNSLVDRAFPFGNPSTCVATYERTRTCFGPWRRAEQVNAGLLVLVAFVVFLLKCGSVLTLLTSASWTHSRRTRPSKHIANSSSQHVEDVEDDPRATMRRLIDNAANDEPYRDELEDTSANLISRVQPPSLGQTRNKWATDEEQGEGSTK